MIPDPPNPDQNSGKAQETVVTPAGRLPKDRVTHVPPGYVIRYNKDGTYTVIKEEHPPTKPEEASPNSKKGR
jgi:hypothetical protein